MMGLEFPRYNNDTQAWEASVRLTEYEFASLANLNPEDAEEALELIPSLRTRFKEDEVTSMIEEMSKITGGAL